MILKNPKNEYRAMPFWSWNGKLEINELKKQAEILEGMGFGGAFFAFSVWFANGIYV